MEHAAIRSVGDPDLWDSWQNRLELQANRPGRGIPSAAQGKNLEPPEIQHPEHHKKIHLVLVHKFNPAQHHRVLVQLRRVTVQHQVTSQKMVVNLKMKVLKMRDPNLI